MSIVQRNGRLFRNENCLLSFLTDSFIFDESQCCLSASFSDMPWSAFKRTLNMKLLDRFEVTSLMKVEHVHAWGCKIVYKVYGALHQSILPLMKSTQSLTLRDEGNRGCRSQRWEHASSFIDIDICTNLPPLLKLLSIRGFVREPAKHCLNSALLG